MAGYVQRRAFLADPSEVQLREKYAGLVVDRLGHIRPVRADKGAVAAYDPLLGLGNAVGVRLQLV